jgi:uncharacterized protein with GYD domain
MAKYLITGSYTVDGTKGLLVEGGSARKAAVEKALEGLGGKLDAIYYAYGDTDVVVIIDVPDAVSALALSLTVNASGAVNIRTTPLLTVSEVDAACRKSVAYRAAGAAAV